MAFCAGELMGSGKVDLRRASNRVIFRNFIPVWAEDFVDNTIEVETPYTSTETIMVKKYPLNGVEGVSDLNYQDSIEAYILEHLLPLLEKHS